MSRNDLCDRYFKWLCDLIDYKEKIDRRMSYLCLFRFLHSTDFYAMMEMDENRAKDGINLRYRFGEDYNYDQTEVETYLGNHPCSVFEMIIALALRCEEDIMYDPTKGRQIGKLFWIMISNLGLGSMNDENYNELYCIEVIRRFQNREYSRDGRGGLFIIENCKYDLRSVEIWNQMCWFLDGILGI